MFVNFPDMLLKDRVLVLDTLLGREEMDKFGNKHLHHSLKQFVVKSFLLFLIEP